MTETNVFPPKPKGLSVRDLSCFREERFLFKNLSFDLEGGQIIQLAGENGTGKTSLIKLLCGLLLPEDGDIYFDSTSIYQLGDIYYQSLCYLGHLPGIKADFTVLENVRFNQSLSSAVDDGALNDAIKQVGLNGFQNSFAANLSAGQKRRVALARLVVNRSPLWILDEPLTALDVKGVEWFENLLVEHLARDGMVILTTHQPLSHESLNPMVVQLGRKAKEAA